MRNQSPMMMMPFPFGMPPQRHEPADSGFTDRIPARVIMAIKYIDNLALYARSEPVAIASDIATEIQIVPGQTLQVDQLQARQAACNLLTQYFNGELKLADWETPPKNDQKHGTGMVIDCMACAGGHRQRPDGKPCELCKGANSILVIPIGGE